MFTLNYILTDYYIITEPKEKHLQVTSNTTTLKNV